MDGVTLDLIKTQQGAVLRKSLETLYTSLFRNPQCLPDYLSDTCVQHVGRLALSYTEILEHVRHLRRLMRQIDYSVVDAIASGDTIADRHIVRLTLNDARSVALEVLCILHVEHGKIVAVYESSQVIEGDEALGVLATATQ